MFGGDIYYKQQDNNKFEILKNESDNFDLQKSGANKYSKNELKELYIFIYYYLPFIKIKNNNIGMDIINDITPLNIGMEGLVFKSDKHDIIIKFIRSQNISENVSKDVPQNISEMDQINMFNSFFNKGGGSNHKSQSKHEYESIIIDNNKINNNKIINLKDFDINFDDPINNYTIQCNYEIDNINKLNTYKSDKKLFLKSMTQIFENVNQIIKNNVSFEKYMDEYFYKYINNYIFVYCDGECNENCDIKNNNKFDIKGFNNYINKIQTNKNNINLKYLKYLNFIISKKAQFSCDQIKDISIQTEKMNNYILIRMMIYDLIILLYCQNKLGIDLYDIKKDNVMIFNDNDDYYFNIVDYGSGTNFNYSKIKGSYKDNKYMYILTTLLEIVLPDKIYFGFIDYLNKYIESPIIIDLIVKIIVNYNKRSNINDGDYNNFDDFLNDINKNDEIYTKSNDHIYIGQVREALKILYNLIHFPKSNQYVYISLLNKYNYMNYHDKIIINKIE